MVAFPIQLQITKSIIFPVRGSPGRLSQPLTWRRITAGSQTPYHDPSGFIYFRTPVLATRPHEINITVTMANETNPFIIDFFYVNVTSDAGGGSSGDTTRSVPSSTMTSSSVSSTPVGAIAGGIVGGIAGIAILAIAVWYFLRRRSRGGQADCFEKPTPGDIVSGEGP